MRLAAKVDGNHAEIVEALRKVGCSVFSLAAVGRGCPDLLFSYRGTNYLCEIKNGNLGWKLTDAQKKFRSTWNAPILIFDSVEAVLMWAKEAA